MSDPNRTDTDPIKDAWSGVADSFTALGRTMKERFDREPETEPAARGADPTAALREAFEALLAAGRELGDKVTGITRDEQLKGQARQVGTSINQALESTINQITGEMRAFFKGSSGERETVDAAATDTTAAETSAPGAPDDGAPVDGTPVDGTEPTSGPA